VPNAETRAAMAEAQAQIADLEKDTGQ